MQKKIAMRMCVVCREMKPKKELMRIVGVDSKASIDPSGKKQGRGAYICLKESCIKRALKQRQIERALEVSCDEEFFNSLMQRADVEENDKQ